MLLVSFINSVASTLLWTSLNEAIYLQLSILIRSIKVKFLHPITQKYLGEIKHMLENSMCISPFFFTMLRDITRSTIVAHISVDSELAPT